MRRLTILSIALLCGCGGSQLRTQAATLNTGASKEAVIAQLGPPGNRSVSGRYEALQWCRTGLDATGDMYVSAILLDGRLYRITSENARVVKVGFCSAGYPPIDWGSMDGRVTVEQPR